MKTTAHPGRRWIERLGWWLVIGSVPIWSLVFITPFVPLPTTARAAFGLGVVIAGELMFWVGAAILGPAVAARLRTPKVNTGSSYAGRTVAVVGATGGLGRSIVEALLREGAHVFALGRDPARLAQFPQSRRLRAERIDLLDSASMIQAASVVGPLDALIVATGVDVRKPFLEHNDEDIAQEIETNLQGPIMLTRVFAANIKPQGVIAHLGGFGDGRLALPYYSADVASRAGLAAFCESVNREFRLENFDIRVSYICPAPADTEAERPFVPLWRRIGTPPVAPAKVADFVLSSALAGKHLAIMGCSSWFISKVNGLWSGAADFMGLHGVGINLREVFGSVRDSPAHPAGVDRPRFAARNALSLSRCSLKTEKMELPS
jgi:NAD(P)-dependent dehydrogenase (short-subunit alcohol dehydrogenase family)